MDGDEALYLPDGDGFVGTIITQGGWDPNAQNGACVLALLGHCLEDVPSLVPMLLARMTVDLVRPVPIGERLHVRHEILREGKKIQVVAQRLLVGDVEHVRSTVLRLRDADVTDLPHLPPSSTSSDPAAALLPPEDCDRMVGRDGYPVPQFLRGVEMRRALLREGPGYGLWVRLDRPVVAGEPIRDTSRLTLGFDFANLINVEFEIASVSMINPDVSAHVLRPPSGEWVGIVGDTRFRHDHGRGFSTVTLSDRDGVFGAASTSQLVQPR